MLTLPYCRESGKGGEVRWCLQLEVSRGLRVDEAGRLGMGGRTASSQGRHPDPGGQDLSPSSGSEVLEERDAVATQKIGGGPPPFEKSENSEPEAEVELVGAKALEVALGGGSGAALWTVLGSPG
ncbi:hypothetical protein P7K49_010757 [Saguinus oedipus]|uniref:Uncharacterized protein n=1 Tax=Saguinus oedipus TaxID=9490 RepID=A0ABQ9VNQ5_SAGOE|nr:hypothetical protein P7K49_010757 [Saguinus oedipus]